MIAAIPAYFFCKGPLARNYPHNIRKFVLVHTYQPESDSSYILPHGAKLGVGFFSLIDTLKPFFHASLSCPGLSCCSLGPIHEVQIIDK